MLKTNIMDNRIQINKDTERLEIVIKSFLDQKKQQLLLIWIILFSLCGLAIISQFFADYEAGDKVFFAVYVAFWIFFEFKVIYAYRWRKFGQELIIIEDNELILIKSVGKRGVTQKFVISDIKKLDFFKDENGGFINSMNKSYWNINKYHLMLLLENSKVPFGIDLEAKDAKQILNEIQNRLKKS